jgi:hypothetical protein
MVWQFSKKLRFGRVLPASLLSDFVVADMWKDSTVEAQYQSHASRVQCGYRGPGSRFPLFTVRASPKQSTSDICNTIINDYDALMLLAAA